MKRHIPTFEQFVNEATDADGFNPAVASDADVKVAEIKSVDELIPGKEYIVTLDGAATSDMIYQGVTDGYHIFNEEDHNVEPKTFSDEALAAIITAGGITQVAM
jgi:hypothetical protein